MNYNDWSDLDTFKHLGAKIGTPYITISARKTITLSSGFMHQSKEQLSGMTHVVLSFSKAKMAIVFKFTNNELLPGATKISAKYGEKGSSSIAARAFFNYYNIDTSCAARYTARLESIPNLGDCWVVYLNQKEGSTASIKI